MGWSFHGSWYSAGHTGDTAYNGSITIFANSDGSISINSPDSRELYPSSNTFFFFCEPNGYGSHDGESCLFDNNYHTLMYISGSGGLGAGGVDTLFATR